MNRQYLCDKCFSSPVPIEAKLNILACTSIKFLAKQLSLIAYQIVTGDIQV